MLVRSGPRYAPPTTVIPITEIMEMPIMRIIMLGAADGEYAGTVSFLLLMRSLYHTLRQPSTAAC